MPSYSLKEIAREIGCPTYVLASWLENQIDLSDGPEFSDTQADNIIHRALRAQLDEYVEEQE
jgi:hypothetical protein